jgi:hypothetical protein
MTRKRLLSTAAWTFLAALIIYIGGFWGVVLLIRSDSELLRVAGLNINYAAYDTLVQASPPGGIIRKLAVDRFLVLCRGYESRCVVKEAALDLVLRSA